MARKLPPKRAQARPEPVGYGHPPSRKRIRDKEVRNPWGRPGKPKPPIDFLDEEVVIRVEGEARKMTRDEALEHFLFAKASKGDVRAIELLAARALARKRDAAVPENTDLSPEEQQAFDRYIRREAHKINRN